MRTDYIVKPVAKALQVLEYVVEEGRELALTEICYKVRLPKTTVFRYLQTLCQAGLISYDAKSDRYRTGVRLWVLGQSAGSRSVLCEVALPSMKQLRDQFNETINLAELHGYEVTYLEMVESRRSLRMLAKVGHRDPACTTAVGKAMLAFLPEEAWRDHLPEQLAPRASGTIQSLEMLHKELLQTRARGYAIDREENEDGACCIGAPLFNPAGHVIAGISLSAPAIRTNQTLLQKIAVSVVEAATDITARLAVRGEPERAD